MFIFWVNNLIRIIFAIYLSFITNFNNDISLIINIIANNI